MTARTLYISSLGLASALASFACGYAFTDGNNTGGGLPQGSTQGHPTAHSQSIQSGGEDSRNKLDAADKESARDYTTVKKSLQDLLLLNPSPKVDEQIKRLWATLGQLDGPAAIQEASAMHKDRRHSIEAVLYGWTDSAPKDSWAWIQSQGGRDQQLQISMVLNRVMEKGQFDLLCEMAGSISDTKVRSQASTNLAIEIALYSPEHSSKLLSTLDADHRAYVISHVTEEWSSSDPAGAMNFLSGLPSGDSRMAIEATMKSWLQKEDSAVVRQWLQSQPSSASKDVSLASYILAPSNLPKGPDPELLSLISSDSSKTSLIKKAIRSSEAEDPETAMTWASSISDASERSRWLQRVAVKWAKNTPELTASYIEKSARLSETDKLELRAAIGRK